MGVVSEAPGGSTCKIPLECISQPQLQSVPTEIELTRHNYKTTGATREDTTKAK